MPYISERFEYTCEQNHRNEFDIAYPVTGGGILGDQPHQPNLPQMLPCAPTEAVTAFYCCLLDDTLARSLGDVEVAIMCPASDPKIPIDHKVGNAFLINEG